MATPELATRARGSFRWDHARSLRQAHEWIDKAPLPNDAFADGVARFAELVGFGRELAPDYFKVKRIGALMLGVGSALDEKYLILFEGPSPAAEDDMIVEAKQIRELASKSLRAHGRGRLARARRAAADRVRAVRLRGGGAARRQVLLDARLDRRLPGSLDRDPDPHAQGPAADRLRRGRADGPGAPQARGRQPDEGAAAGGAALVRVDRSAAADGDARAGRPDGRGLAAVPPGGAPGPNRARWRATMEAPWASPSSDCCSSSSSA